MKWCTRLAWLASLAVIACWPAIAQPANVTSIGGFEGSLPSFWTIGSQPSGSTLSWATDQSRSLGHSLKIVKPTVTADSAAWISDNMCDIWSPQHLKNVDIFLGAYVRTLGVNTAPATEDAKWYISYTFWDSAGALIGTAKLPVNQTTASSGAWVADTNAVGSTILPKDSWKTIIKFVGGKNATGTVWADDFLFYGRAGAWAGQDWNTSVGVPTGWYYWLPPNGGNDGLLNSGFENTTLISEAAHSGTTSLKFNLPFARVPHDGFIGTKRYLFKDLGAGTPIQEGDMLRISVWIKASNLVPDSAAMYPGAWSVGLTPLWFTGNGNNLGYNNVGPGNDYTWAFPAVTQFDWTQYTLDIKVPAGVNAKALETRLHVYARFTGTIYFDDLTIEKLDVPQITAIGGFEGSLPSYWNIGSQPSGSTLSWATDQSRSLGHSLKIVKPGVTADSAAWISDNMADIWSPQHLKNVDIYLGAYVRTLGVNTAPATEDAKWYVSYSFYDSAGALIGTTKLPVNQTTASSGAWVADTNAVGSTILPKDSWKTIIKFVGGKNATGTVWADDFMLYGRAGAWAGQDWNTSVGVPSGWYYWLPPNGGNDGLLNSGFENTTLTKEAAHSGTTSLKFNLPFARVPHDGFVGTRRFKLDGSSVTPPLSVEGLSTGQAIQDGDVLRISVWIKASNLVPDSAAMYPGAWSVGLTPLWFTGDGNNLGYSNVGPGVDYTWAFPPVTQFDWTRYYIDVTVPPGVNAKALEVRLHVYARFTGTIYFDDLTVEKLDVPSISGIGSFEQTLPSYWTIGSQPSGSTLSWATDQSRSLGHSLKIVKPTVTADSAAWISENMADIWSPQHLKNVDIFLGAYVRTLGVNTAPATEDAKWYISYTFWDSAGALIGTAKLPVNQTTASSGAWVADTNAVGSTILPKDAWKTIVKFVGGKNATGTVWADDFLFYGRAGAWAGQDWNTSVGVPTGWYYWLPPNGGNDGLLNSGFENTRLTKEAAHTGLASLKFDLPFSRVPHDGFVGTKRYMLAGSPAIPFTSPLATAKDITTLNAVEGDILRLTVWIKASNLVPDSAALYPGAWGVGFTPLWFPTIGNNSGYSNVGPGVDYVFTFPKATSFDWTPYTLDVQVPTGVNAKALEVRLHPYARFTGTVYFDDLTVEVVGTTTGVATKDGLPGTYELGQNYPNPFNPTTKIQYGLPHDGSVTIVIYNVLGQKVRTLVDEARAAGRYEVNWDGKDDHGRLVGTGLYLYRLETGQFSLVQKMLMLK